MRNRKTQRPNPNPQAPALRRLGMLFVLGLTSCIAQGPMEAPVTLVWPPTRTASPPQPTGIPPTLVEAGPAPNFWIDTDSVTILPERPQVSDVLEFSFTVHNDGEGARERVLVWAAIVRTGLPLTIFTNHAQVDIPANGSAEVLLTLGEIADEERMSPFLRELRDGEYVVAVSVNRELREVVENRFYWQAPDQLETDPSDNVVETRLTVRPFEPSTSEACPPATNLTISALDVALVRPDQSEGVSLAVDTDFLALTIHNTGNPALYSVPVQLVGAGGQSFFYYTLGLKPCGGMDRMFLPVNPAWGEIFTLVLNPADSGGSIPEGDYTDNEVTVTLSALATPSPP